MHEKDKLLEKLEQELKDYKSYVREQGVDFAIDKAYEVIDCLMYDNELSKDQIKALLKFDNVLDDCYDEWLKTDGNLREHLNFSVDKSVNHITDDYKKDKIKANKEAR